MIFVFKIAGAIAETGASLEEVFKIAIDANNNITNQEEFERYVFLTNFNESFEKESQ